MANASEISAFEKLRRRGHTFQTHFRMRYAKPFYLTLVLTLLIVVVPAQAQDVDDVIRTETSLIQLNIGVVDKQGRAITSLTRDDFAVYEDGRIQAISHFATEDVPVTAGLVIDTSGSMRPKYPEVVTSKRQAGL